jgi:hypothetical protein
VVISSHGYHLRYHYTWLSCSPSPSACSTECITPLKDARKCNSVFTAVTSVALPAVGIRPKQVCGITPRTMDLYSNSGFRLLEDSEKSPTHDDVVLRDMKPNKLTMPLNKFQDRNVLKINFAVHPLD